MAGDGGAAITSSYLQAWMFGKGNVKVEKTDSDSSISRLSSNQNVGFLYKSSDVMLIALLVNSINPLGGRQGTSNLYSKGDHYFPVD